MLGVTAARLRQLTYAGRAVERLLEPMRGKAATNNHTVFRHAWYARFCFRGGQVQGMSSMRLHAAMILLAFNYMPSKPRIFSSLRFYIALY